MGTCKGCEGSTCKSSPPTKGECCGGGDCCDDEGVRIEVQYPEIGMSEPDLSEVPRSTSDFHLEQRVRIDGVGEGVVKTIRHHDLGIVVDGSDTESFFVWRYVYPID